MQAYDLGRQGRPAFESAREYAMRMTSRRSVREFSSQSVPRELIRSALEVAAGAPSGVNRQPWRFVAISNPDIRSTVRDLACEQERLERQERERSALVKAVAPFRPSSEKRYLADAPWMIAIFAQQITSTDPGHDPFYVQESVGIATGMLISALHMGGVSSLIHVPVADDYLCEVCGAGESEELFLIVLAGHPSIHAKTPSPGAAKKSFHQVAEFIEEEAE